MMRISSKSARSLRRCSSLALLLLTVWGCAPAHAPPVRFVTATKAEIENTAGAPEVWFEVKEGDELPVHFMFAGVAAGLNEMPLVLKATKPFYLVSRKDGSFFFSFDGKMIAGDAGKFAITLLPGPPSNRAAVIIYVGEPGDLQATMDALAGK